MKTYTVKYEYSFIYDEEVEVEANSLKEAEQIVSGMNEKGELDNGQDSFFQDFQIVSAEEV